jgi:hypothetical protein
VKNVQIEGITRAHRYIYYPTKDMYPTKRTEESYSNKLKYKEETETHVTSSVQVQYTDEDTLTECNSTKHEHKKYK